MIIDYYMIQSYYFLDILIRKKKNTLKNLKILFLNIRCHTIQIFALQKKKILYKLSAPTILKLLWKDIKFITKIKDGNGNYDILENPDTTNGNIKFLFQYNA